MGGDLTGMDEAVRLETGALCILLGGVGNAWGRGAGELAGADAPGQALCLLLLQLFEDLLDGDGLEDVLGGGREDGEDGEGAVLLVLLEAAAQTVRRG